MLGLGLGVLAKLVWDALNHRRPITTRSPHDGDEFLTGTGGNVPITLTYDRRGAIVQRFQCSNGAPVGSVDNFNSVNNNTLSGSGVRVRINKAVFTNNTVCGVGSTAVGPNVAALQIINAAGSVVAQVVGADATSYTTSIRQVVTESYQNLRMLVAGVTTQLTVQTRDPLTPGTVSSPPFISPSVDRPPDRLLEPPTAPSIAPAAVPGATPAPVPASAPGGLPAVAPSPGASPSISPGPSPAPAAPPPTTAPQIITGAGIIQQPAAPVVPATPAEAVLIGGMLVGGPGSTPPASPAGMAAELGRLERKSELTLDRLGPLANLPDVVNAIADLVGLLDDFDPGGSYSIRPACGTDANGAPLPTIDVPIASGLGLHHAVVARLDAIAELIDHHKQLRQPICKGKPTGSPVTVTAVEAE